MEALDTIATIADAVREGTCTAVESVRTCLDAIESGNDAIGAFREVWPESALAAARAVDARRAAGAALGPLAGVPVAVKDNIVTDVGTTACGSRMLETFRAPYSATVIERLRAADAIPVGKTNCDEFAMGSSTEHCALGATRNPWARDRVPGGSSGGSAAAVAARLGPLALGSDTGGSIRQPAAMCGVVGVKPSYGRVSRYGLVAFGSSLDQVGPLTRTVEDAALALAVLAGADPRDATSAPVPVPDYRAALDAPFERLRIGVCPAWRGSGNEPEVDRAVDEAIAVFRSRGAEIVDVDLPLARYGIATYYVLAPAEASSNLARYDGIRYGRRAAMPPGGDLEALYARSRAEGFGPEVQRRIMLGTYVLSAGYYDAFYDRALRVRRLISREYDAVFRSCDALVGPTSPVPAFRRGERADPLTMYLCDVYTANANIAGICAMSVPGGFAARGAEHLPLGVQIQCPAFAEETMLRVARILERETGHGRARPPAAPAGATGGAP